MEHDLMPVYSVESREDYTDRSHGHWLCEGDNYSGHCYTTIKDLFLPLPLSSFWVGSYNTNTV